MFCRQWCHGKSNIHSVVLSFIYESHASVVFFIVYERGVCYPTHYEVHALSIIYRRHDTMEWKKSSIMILIFCWHNFTNTIEYGFMCIGIVEQHITWATNMEKL